MRRALAAVVLAAAWAGAGCRGLPVDPEYSGPVPLPTEVASRYAYSPTDPLFTDWEDPETVGGVVSRWGKMYMSAPGRVMPGWRRVRYWLPADAGPGRQMPAVIVLPMLGGHHPMSDAICSQLAGRGVAVLYLARNFRDIHAQRSPDRLERSLVEATVEARRAIDWLCGRPEIDPDRIGVVGVSLGGIRAAILAAVEPRLKAAVIAFAGAGLADILGESTETHVADYRGAIMARESLTPDGFHARCTAALRSDPLHLAHHIDARNVFLILGAYDSVVPARCGEALWELTGRPAVLRMPTGHWGAFFFFNFLQGPAFDFLTGKLGAGAPPAPVPLSTR